MRLTKRTVAAAVLLAIGVFCCTRVAFYRLPPARAHVVDAATGKPIAGAVVSARWFAAVPNLEDESLVAEIAVAEGLTDESGRATVRGPLALRKGLTIVSKRSPTVSVASLGRIVVREPSSMGYDPKHYVGPIAEAKWGVESFAGEVQWARQREHEYVGIPLSRQPLLEREILKTYEQLPEDLRRRVDAEIARPPTRANPPPRMPLDD
jgi:hypothetical protein